MRAILRALPDSLYTKPVPNNTASISAIIPTAGRTELLSQALNSVLSQTLPVAEVVIVDDNRNNRSARNATHDLARHDSRIRVVDHEGFPGGSAARNYGAAISSSAILAFLDDDDWWEPTKLEKQVASLDESETVGLVYTGLHIVDQQGRTLKRRPAERPVNPVDELARRNYIGTVSSAMIPRDVFMAVGGFDETLPSRQDLDLWLRIAQRYALVAVPDPLTVYVNHASGISKNFAKKIRGHELFLEKHYELYSRNRRLMADYRYATGLLCLKHCQHARARKEFTASLQAKPSARALARLVATVLSAPDRPGDSP